MNDSAQDESFLKKFSEVKRIQDLLRAAPSIPYEIRNKIQELIFNLRETFEELTGLTFEGESYALQIVVIERDNKNLKEKLGIKRRFYCPPKSSSITFGLSDQHVKTSKLFDELKSLLNNDCHYLFLSPLSDLAFRYQSMCNLIVTQREYFARLEEAVNASRDMIKLLKKKHNLDF